MLSLPSKEFSICVRFSPIKYSLRKVCRTVPPTAAAQPATDSVAAVPSDEKSLADKVVVVPEVWEKYETLFALPYRMVYAVTTQNAITFYDTQQPEPFAQVSRIHYVGLNDIAW